MALHHPSIQQKFNTRHFVSCESATNAADLTAVVGSHLGLEMSKQLSAMILKHFMACGPAVLLLDNIETPWEQMGSRTEVEEFLSHLADIPHLALLVRTPVCLLQQISEFFKDHNAGGGKAGESEMV